MVAQMNDSILAVIGSAKWTWFAIGYQTVFAYAVALMIYQLGSLFAGNGFSLATTFAILVAITFIYLLFRPARIRNRLNPSDI